MRHITLKGSPNVSERLSELAEDMHSSDNISRRWHERYTQRFTGKDINPEAIVSRWLINNEFHLLADETLQENVVIVAPEGVLAAVTIESYWQVLKEIRDLVVRLQHQYPAFGQGWLNLETNELMRSLINFNREAE